MADRAGPIQRLLSRTQNHSPGVYLSMTSTDIDSNRPRPLKIAIVRKLSISATDFVDARGKSLAIAAFMALSDRFIPGKPRRREAAICFRMISLVEKTAGGGDSCQYRRPSATHGNLLISNNLPRRGTVFLESVFITEGSSIK